MFSELLKGGGGGGIDLTADLIAHYLLNNNSQDYVGGVATTDTAMTYTGDEAVFSGSGSIDTNDNFVTTGAFSISFWFSLDSINSVDHDTLLSNCEGVASSGIEVHIDPDDEKLTVYMGTNEDALVYSNSAVVIDTLYHSVITYDGTTLKMYLDDTLQTRTDTDTLLDSATDFLIGGSQEGDSKLNGRMSNVRFYDVEVDSTFVTALYDEGYYPKPLTAPTTTNLVAHYPLTGTAEDTTGDYDGTEVGLEYTDDAEFGSMAHFNNTDSVAPIDYITMSEISLTDFTISFTFQNKSSTDTNHIIGENISVLSENYLAIQPTYIQMAIDNTGYGGGTFTADTQPHNYMVIRDGITLTYYRDGTAYGGSANCKTIEYPISLIGASDKLATISRGIKGYLQNFRAYSRALTATERADIIEYEKNFRPIDIDNGLILYYPLANNSLDNYYNEDDATDTSMSYDGTSATFNGSTSSVEIFPYTLTYMQTFTVCFWAYITQGTATSGCLFDNSYRHSNDTGSIWNIGFAIYYLQADDELRVVHKLENPETTTDDLSNTNTSLTSAYSHTPITTSGWVHIAVTMDSNTHEVYLDGQYENSISSTANMNLSTKDNHSVLGVNRDLTDSSFYDGDIARFRFYDELKTSEQIKVIYDTEKGDFI